MATDTRMCHVRMSTHNMHRLKIMEVVFKIKGIIVYSSYRMPARMVIASCAFGTKLMH